MPTPLIETQRDHTWRNWHDTRDVGGQVERFFTPRNRWADDTPIDASRRFAPGLAALCQIIREAERDHKRVRAIGSGWSLCNIGFVNEYLVNTSRLTSWSVGLTPKSVAPSCAAIAERIVFAQCGTQITTLNAGLEARGLALPTSGASNGQTIAGAISTGTHGSAHRVGALHDRVLALHIVAEHGKHYLVQPQRKPVVTPAYCAWLGAELLEDDALFDAALVSFGSFGIVHAVLFEASPLYYLGLFVRQSDYREIAEAACTHDISRLALAQPTPAGAPYHIEFVINPYRRGDGEGGAFTRVYYELTPPPGAALPVVPLAGDETLIGRDLVSVIAVGSELVPAAISGILQQQISSGVPPTNGRVLVRTPGQCFTDSLRTGGGTSLELGVPLTHVAGALAAIFSVCDEHTFGAPVALRYVRASQATLAFTHFAPLTCTIELPGIDAARSRSAHALIEAELTLRGVPHTYHWGQALPRDPDVVRRGFGADRVERWLSARRRFLGPQGQHMFANELLEILDLAK